MATDRGTFQLSADRRSPGPQGGGEPEGFPRVGRSPLIFVLSLLGNAINPNFC
jgi:hypothetical protein